MALGAAPPAAFGKLSAAKARRQLDTAIQWSRFAELVEFDAGTGELILKTAEAGKADAPG